MGDLKEELGRLGGVKATHLCSGGRLQQSVPQDLLRQRPSLTHHGQGGSHCVQCQWECNVGVVTVTVSMTTGLSPYSLFAN